MGGIIDTNVTRFQRGSSAQDRMDLLLPWCCLVWDFSRLLWARSTPKDRYFQRGREEQTIAADASVIYMDDKTDPVIVEGSHSHKSEVFRSVGLCLSVSKC